MNRVTATLLAACTLLTACQAEPRHERNPGDASGGHPAGSRPLPADSSLSRMPVVPADTAGQADMPVSVPPDNVQPK